MVNDGGRQVKQRPPCFCEVIGQESFFSTQKEPRLEPARVQQSCPTYKRCAG
jgi:hypothetical protein